MSLSLALYIVGGLVAGAVAALTVIAPRTETKVDDKFLEVLERLKALEDLVNKK